LLGRFELLAGFLGAWLVSAAALGVLERLRVNKLPNGAITASKITANSRAKAPGTRWSRIGVAAGTGVNSFLTLLIFFLLIFDLWNVVAPYIAFDLPALVNWAGIVGILWADLWGTAVMYYNVNYIPATRAMDGRQALYGSKHRRYVLATGGPYKWVRHPMYVSKILLGLFIFLATGIWLTMFTLIAVVSLPAQARGEEQMLHNLFGRKFDDYAARTGRFLPRISHK
jgi:protein-S-isoprenylcysteine O-methyltransferase Ste14